MQKVTNKEFENIYNSYVGQLVQSYDALKSKFSTYVAKCLSEKQRRDCGMSLAAPAIVMPCDQWPNKADEESKDDSEGQLESRVRMGGRMGSQIKQIQEEQAASLPINRFRLEAKEEHDDVGEEDLSYVSGDERDFNESMELRFNRNV